jgi:pyrophosphatase PpaX
MTNIRATIFDLDGTLVDSLPATMEAFNMVVAPFLGTRLTAREVHGVAGPNHRKILGNFLPGDRLDEGLLRLRVALLAHAPTVGAFPGILDLLGEIRAKGSAVVIATLRDPDSSNVIMASTGLGDAIDGISCSDVNAAGAGGSAIDPNALLRIVSELGIPAAEAAFVGDSAADVEAGRKAGLRTVGVSWGYQRREDLRASQPDFLLDP